MNTLIVGPSWVGDMVMAQSLFKSLKEHNSGTSIDVIAPAWSGALLERMPEINSLLDMPIGHGELAIGKRRKIAHQIKPRNYQQAIVLPNSFKSALIPWFADIPKRTGWRGEARSWILNDCRTLDKESYPLMVQRFVALAYPEGTDLNETIPRPKLEVDEGLRSDSLAIKELNTDTPIVVLCPGAEFGLSKKWPPEYYSEFAKFCIQKGYQVWVMGSANDEKDAQIILSQLPANQQTLCKVLAGKTSLAEAIDLMSLAELVVSNDSGLMHIAAALDRNLIAIYGSTSPDFTPPLSDQVILQSLQLDCRPCFKRTCPLQHLDCLNKLLPSRVIDSAKAFIG